MKKTLLGCALFCVTAGLSAYPLDADQTGIRRLEGYRVIQDRPNTLRLPSGAFLGVEDIHLHLLHNPGWDLNDVPPDPELQTALKRIFSERDPSYGIALVDFTDPEHIRWAGLRPDRAQAPGSVGKILCMLALFDGLQRAFPDPAERALLLAEHQVGAGEWVITDEHKVPRYDAQSGQLSFAVIQPGEVYSLAEWLDHMVSASANSAGSTIWKEAMLLRAFGSNYPPTAEEEAAFFKNTPRAQQRDLAQQIINEALVAANLNPEFLRVGNFWTRRGKQLIPGVGNSTATPKELARFLLRLEQGRLVDEWSSLEMKRYLYMTKRRYRYAYPPELAKAAIYFKSGSLYRCKPEPEYRCGKYRGNVDNAMNSTVIIESPAQAGPEQKRYLVALTSNVLKKNSAWDHARIGAAIEALVRDGYQGPIDETGSDAQIQASGTSD